MRRLSRRKTSPRGYVLLIVLIIGLSAAAAAVALMTTAGGTRIAATSSTLGDRSHALAEAGMQRAVVYLTEVVNEYGDFDAALDTDLDSFPCSTINADDLRPDTTTDADPILEWTDAINASAADSSQTIGGFKYTCVSTGEGRYCVRFEDDYDDAIDETGGGTTTTNNWEAFTGNHEYTQVASSHVTSSAGDPASATKPGCARSTAQQCQEGPPGAGSVCQTDHQGHTHRHHNDGKHNPLRDRNRSVWVTSIGIVPDVDYANAKYTTTLRRLQAANQATSNQGMQVKGHLKRSGSGDFRICTDLNTASLQIDGNACGGGGATGSCGKAGAPAICCPDQNPPQTGSESKTTTATDACAPTDSYADTWENNEWSRCLADACTFDWGDTGGTNLTITPATAAGASKTGLLTPGPTMPAMPDVWDSAGSHIDFARECVFWLESNMDSLATAKVPAPPGGSKSSIAAHLGLPSEVPSLWWWDADENRGPGNELCGDFETTNPRGAMPGPPNPNATASAGPAGGACTDVNDSACWAGCWSPLLLKMGTPLDLAITGSPNYDNCYNPMCGPRKFSVDNTGKLRDVSSELIYDPSATTGRLAEVTLCKGISYEVTNSTGSALTITSNTVGPVTTSVANGATKKILIANKFEIKNTSTSTIINDFTPQLRLREHDEYDGECAWFPTNEAQNYTVKYTATATNDKLNHILNNLGIGTFPDGSELSKPNWQTCRLSWPAKDTVVSPHTLLRETPTGKDSSGNWIAPDDGTCNKTTSGRWNGCYSCTTCDGDPTSGSPVRFVGSGSNERVSPMFNSRDDINAVPVGVYILSGRDPWSGDADWETLGGSSDDVNPWYGLANPLLALPWEDGTCTSVPCTANNVMQAGLKYWPNLTLYTFGEVDFGSDNYSIGIGQEDAGAGNPASSLWGRYPSYISGGLITTNGNGESATAGSIFGLVGVDYRGSGQWWVFGQMFANQGFELSGSGEFLWSYRVPTGASISVAASGGNTSQSIVPW